MPNSAPRKKRWRKRLLTALVTLVVLWIAGDAFHAWYVARSEKAWEATVERTSEGIQVGCEPFSIGEGSTAILFVHGINDSPYVWSKIAPLVAEEGFHCVAMRLPGFAETTEQYAKSDREDWMLAVKDQMSLLQSQHDHVILVAHSLGAAVSLRLIQEDQIQPEGVIFIAPAIAVANDRSPLLPTKTWHWLANRLLFFTQTTMSPFGVDAHDPEARSEEFRTPFTPRTVIDETFALIDANQAHQEPFDLPLVVVVSTDDHVIDSAAAKAFYDQATGAPKKLIEVKDSGHMIPVDRDWQEAAEGIKRFSEAISQKAEPAKEVEAEDER